MRIILEHCERIIVGASVISYWIHLWKYHIKESRSGEASK